MNLLSRFWRQPLAATIDLGDAKVASNPFPHYEALRRTGTVHYLARHQFWIVLGYEAVKTAFDRPDLFSNADYDDVDKVLLAADPPHHTPIRRAVSRLFSGDALARLTAFAEAEAKRLAEGEIDVVGDYAVPFTQAVAAELIGFSGEAVASLRDSLAPHTPFSDTVAHLDRIAGQARCYEKFRQPEYGGFSDQDARSLIRLLWLAATTTTERTIIHGALRLLEDGDLRSRVEAAPALMLPFVEEVLRLNPAESLIRRVTTGQTELGGVTIPGGASVQLCLTAANRDPAHFPDPATVRLDRPQKQHLAFGFGLHFCPGAGLARRLVPIALSALLCRPGFRPLEPLAELSWFAATSTLVPRRLLVGL
jgi:cytochrome P450